MHVSRDARIHLRADVPPGESLVGVHVGELFRVRRLLTKRQPELSLVADGRHWPCNGQEHEITSLSRTLHVGELFALHVVNDGRHPATLDLVVAGLSLGRTSVVPFRQLVGPVLPDPPPEAA
jgi:hypothetical protein